MKVVYKTCDGHIFEDKGSAVRYERGLIEDKVKRMRQLKNLYLPQAQHEYDDTMKRLRLFREANRLARQPRSRYYVELGTIYSHKGCTLATLNKYIAEYRKLKIELDALTK